jgi:phosphonate transport system substrate-binding protein
MSSKLFREVNENDARASVIAYSKLVIENSGLVADPNPVIFTGAADLTELLKCGAVDLLSMPTEEFLALGENLATGPILVSLVNGSDCAEYVLLARTDSAINTLADLKGRQVAVLDNLQGSLAVPWLEVLLDQHKLGAPETFFSRVTRSIKISKAALPVFFGRSDACIITRQGFAVLGELNPQVTQQLRVLATSPELVPFVTCFRAGMAPVVREKLVATITQANTTPAGRQLLTIFQCDRIEERPLSRLQTTRDLLAARARLHTAPISPKTKPDPSAPGLSGETTRLEVRAP